MTAIGAIDALAQLQAQAIRAAHAPDPAAGPQAARATQPAGQPTAAARDELERATRGVALLRSLDRELVFVHDAAAGAMTAELRESGGTVIRRLSATDALDLLDTLGSR